MKLFGNFNNFAKPKKPEDRDEQISMMWDMLYNHLPTWMKFVEIRFNFNWLLFGIIIALLGCLIGLRVAG